MSPYTPKSCPPPEVKNLTIPPDNFNFIPPKEKNGGNVCPYKIFFVEIKKMNLLYLHVFWKTYSTRFDFIIFKNHFWA